jgi:hypothetical protein
VKGITTAQRKDDPTQARTVTALAGLAFFIEDTGRDFEVVSQKPMGRSGHSALLY